MVKLRFSKPVIVVTFSVSYSINGTITFVCTTQPLVYYIQERNIPLTTVISINSSLNPLQCNLMKHNTFQQKRMHLTYGYHKIYENKNGYNHNVYYISTAKCILPYIRIALLYFTFPLHLF